MRSLNNASRIKLVRVFEGHVQFWNHICFAGMTNAGLLRWPILIRRRFAVRAKPISLVDFSVRNGEIQ